MGADKERTGRDSKFDNPTLIYKNLKQVLKFDIQIQIKIQQLKMLYLSFSKTCQVMSSRHL